MLSEKIIVAIFKENTIYFVHWSFCGFLDGAWIDYGFFMGAHIPIDTWSKIHVVLQNLFFYIKI